MDIAVYLNPNSFHSPPHRWESRMEAEIYRALSQRGLNFPPAEVLILNQAPIYFFVKIFKGIFVVLKGEEEVITDFIEAIGTKSTENYHFRMESLREVAEG